MIIFTYWHTKCNNGRFPGIPTLQFAGAEIQCRKLQRAVKSVGGPHRQTHVSASLLLDDQVRRLRTTTAFYVTCMYHHMKLFSFFALQPVFCHICYLHILRFQLIEKLDQSSKLRNSNMQLYRNGAPNPIANSKYGPKRVLKQKSWIWHRKIKKCIYTYIGNIQRQQQHTSLRLQLMHAIVLIIVSPNSARWCVATPAKKL